MDAATGKERRPTVAIDDVPEPTAGVMRTSAADDDQADQQHELADSAPILWLVVINKTIMGVFRQNGSENSTAGTHYLSAHQRSLSTHPITYLLQTGSYDVSIHPRHLSVLPTVVFTLSINQSIKTHFYSAVCRERIRGA